MSRRGARILAICLAVIFLASGLMKLFSVQGAVEQFLAWGYSIAFMHIIGALEVVGALMLLVPRTSGAAAGVLGVVMAGAIYTHLFLDPAPWFAVIPAAVLTALIAVATAPHEEIPGRRTTLQVGRGPEPQPA